MSKTGNQCPYCDGGTTVKRINKMTAAQFLGCDQFPKCKYSRDWNPKTPMRHKYWPTDAGMDIDECYEQWSGYSGNLNGDF